MLVLENLVLFQHLNFWMPCSSCVCVCVWESGLIFTQQYLLELPWPAAPLVLPPPSSPAAALLANSLFFFFNCMQRAYETSLEEWTENSRRQVPVYIFLLNEFFLKQLTSSGLQSETGGKVCDVQANTSFAVGGKRNCWRPGIGTAKHIQWLLCLYELRTNSYGIALMWRLCCLIFSLILSVLK